MTTSGDQITSIAPDPQTDLQTDSTLEAPADVEIVAREANIRRWWRRAIGLIIFVLVVSPLCTVVIWQVHVAHVRAENKLFPTGTAGPPDRVLKDLYRQYNDTEGPSRRGVNFLNLISF